ncbi:META domain-containing protein [Dactylosporangium matsuzakiense]|uniref:META domain-containing protein n=1 Tax=Dactylosporangium matsuzakiense TaxID=53360 RepID=A0A9W6KQ43_9ACTN|nr:META domain-containing protein [Dactylosporangium matsuzakiense]UWZ47433.1 META domain-containing protein [Dactylosporangium matsuzakiense]GLL05182.1 META domain-containing protein [Dactylosporangium matsuzakiense]
MTTWTARIALAAILVLLSACGGGGSGAGAGLAGRTFLSTEVTGHTLVAGTRLEVGFPQDGKLTAQAGCNHLFGDVSFGGGRLQVSGIGTTDMGCEQARGEQDTWLVHFLSAGPSFTLTGDELVLTGAAETIRLVDRRAARPDRALQGTRWVVESVLDGSTAGSVPAGAEAYLQFDGERVTGDGGCNRLSGRAVPGPDTVTFSDVRFTLIACADDRNTLDEAVLATLSGVVTVKIDGDRLELRAADGKGLQLRAG